MQKMNVYIIKLEIFRDGFSSIIGIKIQSFFINNIWTMESRLYKNKNSLKLSYQCFNYFFQSIRITNSRLLYEALIFSSSLMGKTNV